MKAVAEEKTALMEAGMADPAALAEEKLQTTTNRRWRRRRRRRKWIDGGGGGRGGAGSGGSMVAKEEQKRWRRRARRACSMPGAGYTSTTGHIPVSYRTYTRLYQDHRPHERRALGLQL
jgi:hypothetical protein